jgi:hypothetical protein
MPIPTHFPEVNEVIGKDQPEYLPLPAHVIPHDPAGRVVFCWKLSAEDLATIAETGVIWQTVFTFRHPLQPQSLTLEKPKL